MTDAILVSPRAARVQPWAGWFSVALFLVVFAAARLFVAPIFTTDYTNTVNGLHSFLSGATLYTSGYTMPPWSALFLLPLADQPQSVWLALTIALFVAMLVGTERRWSSLILLAHPAFILLIASGNPEWLLVGPGLWLLTTRPKGALRGLAWLLLACKPQTTVFILLIDACFAVRERDRHAFSLAGLIALPALALYPEWFSRLGTLEWSASVLPSLGIGMALLATEVVVVGRAGQFDDWTSLGAYLAPIWTPYMLEYGLTTTVWTLRKSTWPRQLAFVMGSLVIAAVFWQHWHTAEAIGVLLMVVMAAWLAKDKGND